MKLKTRSSWQATAEFAATCLHM